MAHTARRQATCLARAARSLWPVVVIAGGVSAAIYAWPFTVDDAFIVARYARRLATGQGYSIQAGPPSDGVTGPLWLVPLVLGVKLGLDALLVAKLFGLACALGSAVCVLRASRTRAGGKARAPLLAGLLVTAAPLWIWAIGGLETALATLLTTHMMLAASARPEARTWSVGICAALLPWLRPELLPLALAALAMGVLRRSRRALAAVLVALGGLLALLAFRFLLFGHLLPLSAHAKPASLAHGLDYLWLCLRSPAALVLLPFLLFVLRAGALRDRFLLLMLFGHGAVAVVAGGDWMAGARLFVPVVPVACMLAALGFQQVQLRRRMLAWSIATIVIALRLLAGAGELSAVRNAGVLRERRLPALLMALRDLPDPIAILDIGAVGYYSERRLIDLGGLTEASIAYAAGGHIDKHIDAKWLEAQEPGAIVLHSRVAPRIDAQGRVRWFAGYGVERRVLAQPWVMRDYRVIQVVKYDRNYFYLVLTSAAPTAP